jgi:sugar lactone lactonase YvrE
MMVAGAQAAGAAVPRWVNVTPGASPPAGLDQPLAYDAATQQLVLVDRDGNTWLWNGTTWTPTTPVTKPGALTSPVMAYDAATKQLILFGGQRNDTWSWTGSDWVKLAPATSPPATESAALAYDAGTSQLLLFGGNKLPTGAPDADTWSWNGTTWTQLHPATSPEQRSDAAMYYDPAVSQLVLFGGADEETLLGDTWTWTGTTWTKRTPATTPGARIAPAMAYDTNTQQLLLQGGETAAGVQSDVWTWNGTTWAKQTPASPVTPPRASRAMDFDAATNQLVLFSGEDLARVINAPADTWVWTTFAVQTASLPSAAVGVRYSTTLQAVAGTAPYTWSVSAGALPAGLTLSAAGVISGTPTAATTATFTVTALDATTPIATPAVRAFSLKVFPAPRPAVWVGNGGNSNINAFALTASGNAAPIATLSGALTGLNGVSGLAFDPVGELWVSSSNNDAIEQFAPGATGNVAPARVITGPNTGLVTPAQVALDPAGRIYVAEYAAQAIAIFPAGATGNTPPVATITGDKTGLSTPLGVAVNGNALWVANQGNSSLTAYPMNANGNVAPAATISGPVTQLDYPQGLGLDGKGNLLVADFFGASVLKFPLAGPFGAVAPKAVIGGPDAQLSLPDAVDSDAAGRIYVATEGGGENIYTATGNAPTAIIAGSNTGLRGPSSTAVAPPLNLTTRSLPRAALGRRYAEPLAAILGRAPLRWRRSSGRLPRGLRLSRAGRVTGTPLRTGRFKFTVTVRDSGRPAQTDTARVSLVVARAPAVANLAPAHGARRGATTVTVIGTGFATGRGKTSIAFGRIRAPHVRCSSPRRCAARTPPGQTGTIAVTVTVGGLTSTRTNADRYRYTRG